MRQALYVSKLFLGSIAFKTIFILEQSYLVLEVLARYIDPNGFENEEAFKYPYQATNFKKYETLNTK